MRFGPRSISLLCYGSSGMFVQLVEFIRAHATSNANGGQGAGRHLDLRAESNYTTWRLAKINLAIRGIGGQISRGDSFHNDRHPDLKADFILANPPRSTSRTGEGSGWPGTSAGATAYRRRATPTSPGSSTSFTISRRRADPCLRHLAIARRGQTAFVIRLQLSPTHQRHVKSQEKRPTRPPCEGTLVTVVPHDGRNDQSTRVSEQ